MEMLSQYYLSITGDPLSTQQMQQFTRYLDLLLEWNERINLTAIRKPEEIQRKHFMDSISILPEIKVQEGFRLVDIGTGAGFPGIPLKIVLPSIQLTLVESIGKKALFCRRVVDELGLREVSVITDRAEEVGQKSDHRGQYHAAVARAVARLPVLMEYLLPLVAMGGVAIAQKGDTAEEEARGAAHAIAILGGRLRSLRQITVPGIEDNRSLISVEKVRPTPEMYPRKVGIPLKAPLV